MDPLVSVIIPTVNRPSLVLRALFSALQQTYNNLEIIVVVDGPDYATLINCQKIADPRLTSLMLPRNVGGSAARNAGINAAKGDWIALLDDDDVWLPQKIELQMRAAQLIPHALGVMSCVSEFVMPTGTFRWPTQFPRPDEPICDYLFVRNTPFQGGGYLPTPTLLAPKRLLRLCPFTPGLKKHQDWDWVLRAAQIQGVSFTVLPQPLVRIYWEQQRSSTSSTPMWEYSLSWLRQRRCLFTPAAYACFIATQIAAQAAKTRDLKAFLPLLHEMYRFGPPRFFDLYLFFGYWILPQSIRRRIRNFRSRRHLLTFP